MIRTVGSSNDVPRPRETAPAQAAPVVLIPVTAEDVARRKRRLVLGIASVTAAVLLVAGYYYVRAVDPIHAQQSYDAGMRLFDVGRYPEAALAFDRAAGLKPAFADAIFMRGRSNVFDGKIDRAIEDFTAVLAIRPNDTAALVARGREWLELKNYQSSIADSTRALAIDSHQAAAYNLRGLATRNLGDPHKALDDFTRAVELAPSTDNYFQRGATYQMLGDHRSALADFTQVIAMMPDGASAYFARAESRLALGDAPGAERDRRQGRYLDGQ